MTDESPNSENSNILKTFESSYNELLNLRNKFFFMKQTQDAVLGSLYTSTKLSSTFKSTQYKENGSNDSNFRFFSPSWRDNKIDFESNSYKNRGELRLFSPILSPSPLLGRKHDREISSAGSSFSNCISQDRLTKVRNKLTTLLAILKGSVNEERQQKNKYKMFSAETKKRCIDAVA